MGLRNRFTEGDVEAFEELFREFQGPVCGWILRIVRDTGFAEDLTLETFWRIYKTRVRFDPEASFGAWARRIATNLALDHVRRRPSEQRLSDEPIRDNSDDPARQRERCEQIQSAFRRLPPKLQIAATPALIEDRPYREIAEAQGESPNVIRVRVFRAVRLLRKHLDRIGLKP